MIKKIGFSISFFVLSGALISCKTRGFSEGNLSAEKSVSERKISDREIEGFLKKKNWPTYSDYLDYFGKMPSSANLISNSAIQFDFENAETLIVALEKAYPNGNYACLGRDVVLVCDILDIFYRKYASENRVSMIAGSGKSFSAYRSRGFDSLFEVAKKMMLSYGFNPKPFAENIQTARPYVLIDSTSWYSMYNNDVQMSQVRLMMKAAYALVREAGGDMDNVLPKLGSLATHDGGGMGGDQFWLEKNTNVQEYFEAMKTGMKGKWDHPHKTLRMNLKNLSYGDYFWHDTFQEIKVDESGKAVAEPGVGLLSKSIVFSRMIKLNEYIESNEFREKVAKAAKEWNVTTVAKLVENYSKR